MAEDRDITLAGAIRTTAAVRTFREDPVDDATVFRILDLARFAPSGGNRQAWRVVLVRDPDRKRAVRDLYAPVFRQYLAQATAGLVPWAALADESAERAALAGAPEIILGDFGDAGRLAEHLDQVPALLAVFADLTALSAVDKTLDRYSMIGGASIYPFVWNILLAARTEGLGGVMTTVATGREEEVRTILGAPPNLALASLVAVGHPVRRATRLRRRAVDEFTTVDSFNGPAFTGSPPP